MHLSVASRCFQRTGLHTDFTLIFLESLSRSVSHVIR